jgi:DNA (cytosine-5)-methyltransferase 1
VTDGLSVLEICAGAGGQSLGLEQAGFAHDVACEIDPDACETLRLNRPDWNVLQSDVRNLDGKQYRGIDLIAGGVPCPPFSIAGKQLGADDDRDLFPEAMRLVREAKPAAVMLENVRGLASAKFAPYRQSILDTLDDLGYASQWQVLNASEHGVPQLRPRFILAAVKRKHAKHWHWPEPVGSPQTVGEALYPLLVEYGWPGAQAFRQRANGIAPTLVGGSKRHGGPDLGPTRARAAWALLSVDGRGIANEPPGPDTDPDEMFRLTLEMAARVQGFPTDWIFSGRKTAAYRQIGNAFPPPVARAVGLSIKGALAGTSKITVPRPVQQRLLRAV